MRARRLAALGALAPRWRPPASAPATFAARSTPSARSAASVLRGERPLQRRRPDCATSRRRYVHHAGGDADACVPEACGANPIDAVSAGGSHACLVRTDGSLWCWGRNDRRPARRRDAHAARAPGAGRAASTTRSRSPPATSTPARCGSGGAVFCWGADDAGQLGDGGVTDRGRPSGSPASRSRSRPRSMTRRPSRSSPREEFLVRGRRGRDGVLCWGDDSVGQLGDARRGGRATARTQVVAGVTDIKAIAASWQHACALTTAGQVSCWGANNQGQIGDGTTTGPRAPTAPDPASLSPTIRVTSVVTGHEHTCAAVQRRPDAAGAATRRDRSIRRRPARARSRRPSRSAPPPIRLPSPPARSTPASSARAAAKTSTAGARTAASSSATARRSGNATAIVAGGAFSCVLASDDALYCWGDNHFGQLAIGGNTVRATPAPVPGLAHVTALAAGGAHTCATADDVSGARALFCWGANGSGQLGNGSSIDAAGGDAHLVAGADRDRRRRAAHLRVPRRQAAPLLGLGRLGPARAAGRLRHGRHRPDRHRSVSPRGRRRRVRGRRRRPRTPASAPPSPRRCSASASTSTASSATVVRPPIRAIRIRFRRRSPSRGRLRRCSPSRSRGRRRRAHLRARRGRGHLVLGPRRRGPAR